jgi:hypothetical protein
VSDQPKARDQLRPYSLNQWTKLVLLIPFNGLNNQEQLQDFRDDLADRFQGKWETAFEYVIKSNDRIINKAIGLLAFDGLVIAALGIWRLESQVARSIGGICAAASATILLVTHFIVSTGQPGDYKEAATDFSAFVVEIVRRAKYIFVAAVLSIASVLVLLVALLFPAPECTCPACAVYFAHFETIRSE